MIEVYKQLYVGSQEDYECNVKFQEGWAVVQACKEPYHRNALGYRGRAAPKTHPEYLIARRNERLILNLIDADNPAYIPHEIIDAAIQFISWNLGEGCKVLLHCNQGMSRSPSIGLLYLVGHTDLLPKSSLEGAEQAFHEVYPMYNPALGMRGYMQMNWAKHAGVEGDDVG